MKEFFYTLCGVLLSATTITAQLTLTNEDYTDSDLVAKRQISLNTELAAPGDLEQPATTLLADYPPLITTTTIGAFAPDLALDFQLGHQQPKKDKGSQVYRMNPWVSLGIVLASWGSNAVLLTRIKEKDNLDDAALAAVDPDNVPGFDRWALRQDPEESGKFHRLSDRIFEGATVLPIFLLLDRSIRRDWLETILLYAETQSVASITYAASPFGPQFVNRYRPIVYYESVDYDQRVYGEQRNSMFSGHVSTIAASTFFAAKVYTDYHPELGGKKYIFYGLAAVPALASAYYRIKALKHFPSDTMIGGIVGAGIGWLVPALHKRWAERTADRFSLSGYYGTDGKGLAVLARF